MTFCSRRIVSSKRSRSAVGTCRRRLVAEGHQFAIEIDAFADCIRTVAKPSSGEKGLQDHRLMEAISEAAQTGSTVSIQ